MFLPSTAANYHFGGRLVCALVLHTQTYTKSSFLLKKLDVLVTNYMNKHTIFQELAEQHLVLVTLFVSLHRLALTIIEDNCSGHSAQHLQDEVIHLRIKVSRHGTQLPAHFLLSGMLWTSALASELSTCL